MAKSKKRKAKKPSLWKRLPWWGKILMFPFMLIWWILKPFISLFIPDSIMGAFDAASNVATVAGEVEAMGDLVDVTSAIETGDFEGAFDSQFDAIETLENTIETQEALDVKGNIAGAVGGAASGLVDGKVGALAQKGAEKAAEKATEKAIDKADQKATDKLKKMFSK